MGFRREITGEECDNRNMDYTNYSFLVFDWNGTLVNDCQLCFDLLNKMLKERGHPMVSFETYRDIFTFPILSYYKKAGFCFKPEGEDDFALLASEFRADYEEAFPSLSLYPDALPFLETAKERLPLYLLSATREDLLLKETKEKGIDGYFHALIGIKDIYGASKEAAGKAFFEKANLDPSKALFIGDSLHDEEVAMSFGADCVLIANGHQSKKVLSEGKKRKKTEIFASLEDFSAVLFAKK